MVCHPGVKLENLFRIRYPGSGIPGQGTGESTGGAKKDLAEQIKLEVQNAYFSLKETAERIAVTKDAVNQGEENLRLNEERYKEQVGTATDVIDAQTLLTRVRVNNNNAIYDHQVQKAQMLRAIGRIYNLSPPQDPLAVR